MPDLEDTITEGLEAELPEGTETPTTEGGAAAPVVKTENDEWKGALAKLTENVTKLTTQKAPEVPETPEQRDAKWAVFSPEKADPKFFHNLFNLPDDVDPKVVDKIRAAWGLMQNGLMRQAITGARNAVMIDHGDKLSRIDELEQWRSQATAKELRANFNETYPALADPIYNDIIKLAANELGAKDFKDHAEYFKALAERAAVTIKSVRPDFDLGAGKTTKTTGKPTLPRTRVGGTGGTGGGGKPAQAASDDDSNSLEM